MNLINELSEKLQIRDGFLFGLFLKKNQKKKNQAITFKIFRINYF